MNFFWVVSAKKLKQVSIITFAALFGAGVFIAERDSIETFSNLSPGQGAIYSVKTDKKQIALTFDISWGEERTGPILDVLEKKGLKKATFFLSGPWAEKHPEMVKRIVDMGYEIASHGYRHDNYSQYDSEEKIKEQISKAHDSLVRVSGKTPNLIRMPNGDFNNRVLKVAHELGYKTIQWDTDSLDWKNPGVENIIKRVTGKAHPGDIVLMHASDSCKQTHEALPAILDHLTNEKYEFVSVSELIAGSDIKLNPVNNKKN